MDLQKLLGMLFGRNALQQAAGPQGQQAPQTQNSQNPGIDINQIMQMAQQQADEERKKKIIAAMMARGGPQWQGPLQQ